MSDTPPQEVIDAIESGSTQITRRVEFYEADGVTPWLPAGSDLSRLIDGSVSIDGTRDERRTLDVSLSNIDGALRPSPYDGLWYDKVIKPYRGVRYGVSNQPPRVAIIDAIDNAHAYAWRQTLTSLGYSRTDVLLGAATLDDLADYSIVVAVRDYGAVTKYNLLEAAYAAGKNIITQGNDNSPVQVPLIAASVSTGGSLTYEIVPPTVDNPLAGGWTQENEATDSGQVITAISPGAIVVAQMHDGGGVLRPAAIIQESDKGARWFHYQPSSAGTQAKALFAKALEWLRNYEPYKNWEIQTGEFVIDNISEDNFPYQVKVTGRDYTKRCLLSKIEQAESFDSGTKITDLIIALASNAGIDKFRIPATDDTITSRMDFDRGTERWAVMKGAASSINYELFFDNQGYLVMRQKLDPTFGAITMTFQTGSAGNLVSYTRSVNDSRIYNHVVVYGDPSDGEEDRLPYFGEAKNLEPSSPTHIRQPGEVSGLEDRLYTFASTFFTSDDQCQAYAEQLLKTTALESYELNFSSLHYPWLEANEIIEFLDPKRTPLDPTRFLMDTISLPLGLGPMSATGKRVTYVGDPNAGTDTQQEQVA